MDIHLTHNQCGDCREKEADGDDRELHFYGKDAAERFKRVQEWAVFSTSRSGPIFIAKIILGPSSTESVYMSVNDNWMPLGTANHSLTGDSVSPHQLSFLPSFSQDYKLYDLM